jgi:hypothetical protein
MAVLDNATRIALWTEVMRDVLNCPSGITKAELRAAVDAIDDWVDSSTSSFNTAIPQPARTAMTAKQKAALLMMVVARRYKVA